MNSDRLLKAAFILAFSLFSALSYSQVKRTMHYFPDGRDIVCVNGENRFTRALYGTHTRFRLETSDRPVFATYDKEKSYSLRFSLSLDGRDLQLDSTSFCEARYQGGMRSYVVRDRSWGEGELKITALASFFGEGAIWKVEASGFSGKPVLKVRRCHIAGTKFNRDGDLGMDPRELFEPSEGEEELITAECQLVAESYVVYENSGKLETLSAEKGRPVFDKEEAAREELVGRVEFNTPDPFLNTIGANLVAAADGYWDEKTFLHGAIGWRTPLAGWRGAYAGDVMGWNDRAVSHFTAYSHSMLTDVPPTMPQPQQEPTYMAASLKEFGTPIYSNGYICKLPERTDVISHYDMNLNYIDELLWHFSYDADTTFMRQMWPYIKLHHEWEKRNFDPDNDHLYDAFCCIWASDALYYSGGAVTHSSAYNYRSNLLTARIAEILGEDPAPYREEAEAILKAMNSRLWMDGLGYWAEYQDYMGHKRLHKSSSIWTIYTPIDCDACTPEQAYRATRYVDRSTPHIPVVYEYDREALKALGLKLPKPSKDLFTVSTTDWMPYVWSTNNVAHDEVSNMALAYLQAGRNDSGFKLLKADILDEMYLGACPGNFGQISFYDKAKNEAYRDFADNVGITSRALVNGLFGIIPDALNGRCILRPAFPDEWKEASIKTPYLSYSYRREGRFDVWEIEQHFTQPLKIVIRTNAGGGAYLETEGTSEEKQTIRIDRRDLPKAPVYKEIKSAKADAGSRKYLEKMGLSDISRKAAKGRMVDISAFFNSNVDDIFRNEYISPRPPFTTLEIPKQGVGEWCVPSENHEIEDSCLRATIKDGVFDTGLGLKFLSPSEGRNIVYTSLWDNYPESVEIPLDGKAGHAYLMLAGSTNNMQSRIENGQIIVTYTDGSTDTMSLENPVNWCPIEQEYYTDNRAFWTASKKPYRVLLGDCGKGARVTREVSVNFARAAENDQLYDAVKATDKIIPDGAAQILKMPLDRSKELKSLRIVSISNDVVVGLMGITLEK